MTKQEFLQKIKLKNLDLKIAEIEGIFYILKKSKKTLTLQELITKTGLPKTTSVNFLKSIPSLIKDPNKIELTKEGKEITSPFTLDKHSWSLLSIKNKSSIKQLNEIRERYKLQPKREYDQFFATIKTSIQKAEIVARKGLTKRTSIALIGDDDLVSVVLALNFKDILKITVLEIDEKIIEAINKISKDYNLNIETIKYDARNEIPNFLLQRFDVVLTDPPYTTNGIEIFLDRSISLLKPHKDFSGSYIFLNFGNSFKSPEKTLKIQEAISRYNLFIEDALYKFNRYNGAESVGNTSSLYILKTTPNTKAKNYKVKKIYTYEVIEEKNFPYVEQYSFKLLEVPSELLRSKNRLDQEVRKFCKEHSLKIEDFKLTTFKNGGETFTYILKNSNLIIHTWPEFRALHIDLITCSPVQNSNRLLDTLSKCFNTEYIDFKRVE